MKKIIFSILGIACLSGLFFAFGPEGTNKNYNLPYDNNLNTLRIGWLNNGSQNDSLLVHANNGNWVRRIAPLSTTLAGYPTNSQLTSTLLGYVTTSALSSQLSSYATTASVNTGLSAKANNSNTITVNGVSATLGSNPVFNVKSVATYSGTTNASGNYTVTFPTAYAVAPNVQANVIAGTDTQTIRITSVSATAVTVLVRNRVDVIGLLPTYNNVSGANVDIIVTPK